MLINKDIEIQINSLYSKNGKSNYFEMVILVISKQKKKVIGLFTSRYTITKEKFFVNNSIEPIISNFQMMTAYSIEEMCRGIITGNDLFCSQHVADINKQYHCD